MKNFRSLILSSFTVFVFASCTNSSPIITTTDNPQVEFAIDKIQEQILNTDFSYKVKLSIKENIEAQSFTITTLNETIHIKGGDATGLMYGGLELAELIALDYDLNNLFIAKTPFQKNRGLKFNIPLDARCPSYDDTGDAAQKNIENMWDFKFWTTYFDRMAEHRYNVLSLWTPNPFQVMCKLPDYPNLALDDICVTTAIPGGKVGEWSDAGGVNDVVLKNLKTVKEISIDEKIKFWQKVFDYAESRGVDVYLFTWNIYTNGTFGKYGLTDEIDNPKTLAYYRQAINVFLQTYPQIKGIGVTAGERMHVSQGKDEADIREKWLWDAYGEGILDYKKNNPDREIKFIHRIWYSRFDQIMKYWDAYPDPFEVGYKYVKARIYSSPKESPFIGSLKTSLKENNLKCWWNLRNDDIYVYRWGDPDYVREFISNLPKNVTAGYHMGPDGYVFGRVFSDKDSSINGSLEFDKHWYKFMLWGRLGYDNKLYNGHIKRMLAKRYNISNESELFDLWQTASKIVPQINRFMFHTGDRHWSPEMCASRESFKFTPCFRISNPMPGCNIVNPYKFAISDKNTHSAKHIYPDQIADSLEYWSEKSISGSIDLNYSATEGKHIKADIEAFGWLGKYYAQKIKAAVLMEEIAVNGKTQRKVDQLNRLMQKATDSWMGYADISNKHYKTQMYSRLNTMDWDRLLLDVKRDQEVVRNMYAKLTLKSLQVTEDKSLKLKFPYKVSNKWVRISIPKDGNVEIALFDKRNELINFYSHPCKAGESTLVWEDLTWMPKGKYTMILMFEGKTSSCTFNL